MRGLFGAALKNNPSLHKAVITGILRVAKESLFSGVNNLKVYSILNQRYSEYFGFTETEVNHILVNPIYLKKQVILRLGITDINLVTRLFIILGRLSIALKKKEK